MDGKMSNQPIKFKKIKTEYVSMDSVEIVDDLHGIDEQIRCVLGDIEDGYKNKKYNDFKIIVYGRKV